MKKVLLISGVLVLSGILLLLFVYGATLIKPYQIDRDWTGYNLTVDQIFARGTNLSINGTGGNCTACVDGTNGTNGINGLNGTNGINGLNGTHGTNGTNGINGLNGTNGINGLNGTHGTNGTNGINGLNGTNGINGLNGTTTTLNWTGLQNYPVACPAGSFITQLDDSVTCTVDVDTTNCSVEYSCDDVIYGGNTTWRDANIPDESAIEAYIFDNDNDADLNLTGHNITVDCVYYSNGAKECGI